MPCCWSCTGCDIIMPTTPMWSRKTQGPTVLLNELAVCISYYGSGPLKRTKRKWCSHTVSLSQQQLLNFKLIFI